MRYNIGDYLHCDSKDKNKYCVVGTGEENGYIYYILLNTGTQKEETLLADFVDSKFEKFRFGFFKTNLLYFYNFFRMKTLKKAIWEIFLYIFINIAMVAPVFVVFLGFDYIMNLEVNFFDEYSFLRVVLFIWFLIVNFAYFWDKFGSDIKKHL